jgi:hypothetical protein
LNKNVYSRPVEVAVISLQPLVHHATVPHPHDVAFAECLSKGWTGKNLMVQAMTVCWVQQHCPSKFFDDHNWGGLAL